MKKVIRNNVKRIAAGILSGILVLASFSGSFALMSVEARAASTLTVIDSNGKTSLSGIKAYGALNTTGTTTYYVGNNGWYGVTDGSSKSTPYWELVDTDAKVGSTNLTSSWGSANTSSSGTTLLNAVNGFSTTYFNPIKSAMITQNVSIDNNVSTSTADGSENGYINVKTGTSGSGSGSVSNAYMWPLAYSGNAALSGKIRNNAGAYVWTKTYAGYSYKSGSATSSLIASVVGANSAAATQAAASSAASSLLAKGYTSYSGKVAAASSVSYQTNTSTSSFVGHGNGGDSNDAAYGARSDASKSCVDAGWTSFSAVSSATKNGNNYWNGTATVWGRKVASTAYTSWPATATAWGYKAPSMISSGSNLAWGVNDTTGGKTSQAVATSNRVAPAFNLNLNKVLISRSQSSANFASYSSPSGGNVYLTVNTDGTYSPSFTAKTGDTAISGKTLKGYNTAGSVYDISYEGATGSDMVTAVLYSSSGVPVAGGKIADVPSGSTSGTASIDLSTVSKAGEYILAVFAEDPDTGYASSPVVATLEIDGNFHTGVTFVNKNDDTVAEGDVIKAENIYASYASKEENGSIPTVSAEDHSDMYVVDAEDWEKEGSFHTIDGNTNLKKELTITGTDSGLYDYYAVVIDSNSSLGYWVSPKYTASMNENSVEFDDKTWYTATENDIEWHYKLNSAGDIIGLYTESSIVPIVDGGNTLNIPTKVAGRTVVGIGSGTSEHPFIPSSERSWTSVSFPSSVAIIQDYAFIDSDASANIVIPSTVTNIGIKAFYRASLISLKVNEVNGTIGSLAFGEVPNLQTVTIKGGASGLTISTIAFRDSHATSVTINGNVTVNKNAFKSNVSLGKIYIDGNVTLKEYAFSGCSSVDTLNLSGKVSIGKYAFTNLTSLGHLYLPNTVTLEEYAFKGCTSLIRVETDTDLVNHSFEDCNQIQTLILDEHVSRVGYDWEGHCGSYSNRKIYVRNTETVFEMYGEDSTYISPFGSTGDIIVYIINDKSVDQGKDVEAEDNILSLLGYTCYAHSSDYQNYIFGTAHSVTFYTTNNIADQLGRDDIVLDDDVVIEQSGIEAYYNGVLLTTRELVKDNMKVIPVYGSNEGDTPYSSDEFYVIRTSEFNTLEYNSELTLENVSALEPVTAKDDDLDSDSTTGSLSVTVIVFYEKDEQTLYYSTPVIVRLEKYTAESFVEQEYGSYENIVNSLAELSEKVSELQERINELEGASEADAETINELTRELVAYQTAYEELLEKLADYMESADTDETGYFGTYTDPETGETSDVVYIEGNPTTYQETGDTTGDGKEIYTAQYDVDGDGEKETIKFYVDENGIHLVDENGEDTGAVYTDTLGAVERKIAAKLKEVEGSLKASKDGLNSIIEALKAAGYEFDLDITIDQAYKAIVEDINDMASRITELDSRLTTANNSISQYEQALANIYALLTNSTLEKDNIDGISNALNAIVEKISTLKNNLAVAQATVKDLQDQLDEKESALSALDQELQTTKDQLANANAEIREAEQAKSDLQAQYEKALADGDTAAAERLQEQIEETEAALAQLRAVQGTLAQKEQDIKDAQDTILQLQKQIEDKNKEIELLQAQLDALTDTADGYKITVDTANKLFGLSLPEDASNKDISDAINEYVKQKLSADETIEAIQKVVNSTNTGTDLVADVRNAVGSGTGSTEGMIDDTVVNTKSNNYKTGYQAGYEAGAAAGGNLDDSVINTESNNYKSGYAAGLLAGSTGKTDDDTVNVNSESYKKGYSTGYNEGYLKAAKELDTSGSNNSSGDTSSSEVESLKSQVSTLTGQVSALTTKNSELSAQVSSLTTKNSSLTNDVSKLSTDLKTASDDNTTLKKKVNKLDDKVDDLEDDNKELENKNSSLESSNSGLTSEVGSLKNEVDSLKSTNSGLQNQVNDLTGKNNSMNEEITSLKSRNMGSNTTTTTTTSTTKNSSSDTTKKKEKEKEKSDKDDTLEGSTTKIDSVSEAAAVQMAAVPDTLASGTLVAAENSQKKLGTTSEISMFSDSQINSIPQGQYAKGKVIKFTESNPVVKISDSNGKEINDISEDSLNNIYKIFQYYANHIEDLGNMGSDDVVNAAADETKSVLLKVVAAGDIMPNQHQEAAFANKQSAKLETTFPGIVNGALYLMVHERADNPGQYELCLTTASDDNLSMNVSSLSPVGIAKVEIKDAATTADGTLVDAEAQQMDTGAPQEKRGGLGIILIVLLFLVLIVTGGFLLITKLKRDGRLPEFLNGMFAEE